MLMEEPIIVEDKVILRTFSELHAVCDKVICAPLLPAYFFISARGG